MNRRYLPAQFLSLALLFLTSCGGSETGTAGAEGNRASARARAVTIKGSDTMVILGQRFAEEYMKKVPGSVIQVNGGGSGTGFAALINGSAQLAQASREIKPDEREKLEAKGLSVDETPVAIDALSIFVHETNPIKELTLEQIAGIYTGRTTNWNQIGGADKPIVLYGRESSSGTYDYFRERVLERKDFATRVQTLQGTAAIINAVSQDPNGIGYGGIAYAKSVRSVAVKKDPAAVGVLPDRGNVENGSYPISRKLFFYSVSSAPEEAKRFVTWAISPDGQALVDEVGYFPLPRVTGTAETVPAAETVTAATVTGR